MLVWIGLACAQVTGARSTTGFTHECAAHVTNNQAMEAAVNIAEKSTVLNSILPLACEDHYKIASEAVVYTNKCLQEMDRLRQRS